MRFKQIEYINKYGDSVIFGKNSVTKESDFQLLKVTGLFKSSSNIFKNDTIDSQLKIFKGNRLSERQLIIRIAIQPKVEITDDIDTKWNKKEEKIISLINFLSSTDIQHEEDQGTLIFTSRSGSKFVIKKAIVQSIESADNGNAYNNYIELDITIKSYDPYIYDGGGSQFVILDLTHDSVLTDFVKTGETVPEYDSRIQAELETVLGSYEDIQVRDGYISSDGIFFAVDEWDENTNETHNGLFWLADSLSTTIKNLGVNSYPTVTINGYCKDVRISNKTTDQTFELDMEINAGEKVVIDMENKTCLLYYIDDNDLEQTVDVRNYITLDSSWLYLTNGGNDIEVSPWEAEVETFNVEVGWEVRYEGIGV